MARERRTPTEVSRLFAEAISAGDLEGALACWSPPAVIVAADGSAVQGHAALSQHFQALIAAGVQLQISASDEICTDLGASATTHMTATVPTGGKAVVTRVSAVVMYVPGPGGLQILIDRIKPPTS